MSPGWKFVKELKITWIIGLIVFLIINLVLLSSTWMNDGPLLTTSGILYPDFLPDWIYGLPDPCARSTCCGRRCRMWAHGVPSQMRLARTLSLQYALGPATT